MVSIAGAAGAGARAAAGSAPSAGALRTPPDAAATAAERLSSEVIASGQRYANPANTQVLGGYGLLNLTASTALGQGVTLLARVDNATDKDYQLVRNYATAGRTFYLGVKWTPKL